MADLKDIQVELRGAETAGGTTLEERVICYHKGAEVEVRRSDKGLTVVLKQSHGKPTVTVEARGAAIWVEMKHE